MGVLSFYILDAEERPDMWMISCQSTLQDWERMSLWATNFYPHLLFVLLVKLVVTSIQRTVFRMVPF